MLVIGIALVYSSHDVSSTHLSRKTPNLFSWRISSLFSLQKRKQLKFSHFLTKTQTETFLGMKWRMFACKGSSKKLSPVLLLYAFFLENFIASNCQSSIQCRTLTVQSADLIIF